MRNVREFRRLVTLHLLALAGLVVLTGCGKKGPPLEPTVSKPARIREFTAKRFDDTVYVRLTVPDVDQSGGPANLDRVEVYAFTAKAATELDDPKLATLVATVPVARVVTAEDEAKWEKKGVPPPPNPGTPIGGIAVVTERITPDLLTPIVSRRARARAVVPEVESVLALPLTGPLPEARLKRFYLARGVSRKGAKGADSTIVGVPLGPPPPPPVALTATPAATAVTVAWAPPAEQRLPIQEPPIKDEVLKGTTKGMPPRVVYTYSVYLAAKAPDAPADAAAAAPAAAAGVEMPTPLTAKPVADTSFSDANASFGAERCWVVRSVETVDTAAFEGPASSPVCVTPADTYPPPPPTALAAVASAGAVSLIWEGVEAADLAGYVVMRAEGAEALAPLFETPIRETTYRDATAKPGVRYTYAVVSVDTATPRNVSAPSNRVEESAR